MFQVLDADDVVVQKIRHPAMDEFDIHMLKVVDLRAHARAAPFMGIADFVLIKFKNIGPVGLEKFTNRFQQDGEAPFYVVGAAQEADGMG